ERQVLVAFGLRAQRRDVLGAELHRVAIAVRADLAFGDQLLQLFTAQLQLAQRLLEGEEIFVVFGHGPTSKRRGRGIGTRRGNAADSEVGPRWDCRSLPHERGLASHLRPVTAGSLAARRQLTAGSLAAAVGRLEARAHGVVLATALSEPLLELVVLVLAA